MPLGRSGAKAKEPAKAKAPAKGKAPAKVGAPPAKASVQCSGSAPKAPPAPVVKAPAAQVVKAKAPDSIVKEPAKARAPEQGKAPAKVGAPPAKGPPKAGPAPKAVFRGSALTFAGRYPPRDGIKRARFLAERDWWHDWRKTVWDYHPSDNQDDFYGYLRARIQLDAPEYDTEIGYYMRLWSEAAVSR